MNVTVNRVRDRVSGGVTSRQSGVGVDIIHIENSVENSLFIEWEVTNLTGLSDVSGQIIVQTLGGSFIEQMSWSENLSGGDPNTMRFSRVIDFNLSSDTDVEVYVDAAGASSLDSDTQQTTILVDEPVSGDVSITNVSAPDVQEGDVSTGTVTISNDTNVALGFDIFWFVDGSEVGSESIGGAFEHPSGSTLSYSMDLGIFDPGSHTVEAVVTNFTESLPELSRGVTMTVESDSNGGGGNGDNGGNGDGLTGEARISGLAVPDVQEGESIQASVNVENATNKDLSFSVFWFVNGALESESGESLPSGASSGYTADLGTYPVGSHDVEVIVTNFSESLPQLMDNTTVSVTESGNGNGNGGTPTVGFDPNVFDLTANPTPPWEPNQSVDVTVHFENQGDESGTASRDIIVNDNAVENVMVSLGGFGDTATATATVQIPDVSPTTISLSDSTLSIEGAVGRKESGLGTGAIAAVVIVGLILAYLRSKGEL